MPCLGQTGNTGSCSQTACHFATGKALQRQRKNIFCISAFKLKLRHTHSFSVRLMSKADIY
uniref:Uncharacterized protein n=1 Tax=Anguilla anguilla TaxID=7936 RepID=A0A0E9XPN9_ANGAN